MTSAPLEANTTLRKRARVDSDVSAPRRNDFPKVEEIEHHGSFWFDDGDVILVSGTTAFRVHASVLSRQSNILRDLLTRNRDTEMMGGCAVVRLSDSVGDLTNLMSTFYESKHFLAVNDDVSRNLVLSLGRVGHKYNIEYLRAYAIDKLKAYFPSTFDEFIENDFEDDPETLIGSVNLARSMGVVSVLPAALYQCTVLRVKELLDGVRRDDGTVDRLSSEDLSRCLNGRRQLRHANNIGTAWLFNLKTGKECSSKDICLRILRRLPEQWHTLGWFTTSAVLSVAEGTFLTLLNDLCAYCKAQVEENERDGRRKIWVSLPQYMGVKVEGWET